MEVWLCGGNIDEAVLPRERLVNIRAVYSNEGAHVALKTDGTVVAWGKINSGGEIKHTKQTELTEVKEIFTQKRSFAALKEDGTLVVWGAPDLEGKQKIVEVDKVVRVGGVNTGDIYYTVKNDGDVSALHVAAKDAFVWRSFVSDDPNIKELFSQVKYIVTNRNGTAAGLLTDGSILTWEWFQSGSSYIAPKKLEVSSVKEIYVNKSAFAALRDDGSVYTWGSKKHGGDSSLVQDKLINVKKIFATQTAFAALKEDGAVVTWGKNNYSSNSFNYKQVQKDLVNVKKIISTEGLYLAIKENGEVVSWGSSPVSSATLKPSKLFNVKTISSINHGAAYAALQKDGRVVTWGNFSALSRISNGSHVYHYSMKALFSANDNFIGVDDGSVHFWGNDYASARTLKDYFGKPVNIARIKNVLSTSGNGVSGTYDSENQFPYAKGAFAALSSDGAVVTWGNKRTGGDSSKVRSLLNSIQSIHSSRGAFAALREDGRVIVWGDDRSGGNNNQVYNKLHNIKSISSSKDGFAAYDASGSLVSWGSSFIEQSVKNVLKSSDKIESLYSNESGFAVIKKNRSVVGWPFSLASTKQQEYLFGMLKQVRSISVSKYAFAGITDLGKVVIWNQNLEGSSKAIVEVDDVKQVFASDYHFVLLKKDGTRTIVECSKEKGRLKAECRLIYSSLDFQP